MWNKMKNKKAYKSTYIILAILILLCSCNTRKEYYVVDTIKIVAEPYLGDSIKEEKTSVSFIEPQEVISIDSMIVILSKQKKGFINVICCNTDSVIASFGEFGHAENEFIDFPHNIYSKVNPETGEHLLYIPDKGDRITRIVNIEKSIKKGVCSIDSTFKNSISGKGEKAVFQIAEKHFLYCYGISYDDPRDNIFESPVWHELNGENHWEYQPHPKLISTPSPAIMFAAYAAKNQPSPDMKHFVSMMKFIDNVSLCNLETKEVVGVTTNETYDFEQFELMQTENSVADKLFLYNIDVSTSNKFVFLLKTHMLYGEYERMEESGIYNYQTFLHIYDWDGNLIKKFQLEPGLRVFCYNETVGALYCSKCTGEIVKYNISKLLSQ